MLLRQLRCSVLGRCLLLAVMAERTSVATGYRPRLWAVSTLVNHEVGLREEKIPKTRVPAWVRRGANAG